MKASTEQSSEQRKAPNASTVHRLQHGADHRVETEPDLFAP